MTPWLLALVPLAVLAAVVGRLVVGSRRGDFGRDPRTGRARAPWLWAVAGGVGAWVVLRLLSEL